MKYLMKKNNPKEKITDGWLNLKKSEGYSSAFVVAKIKKKFSLKKIGHLGTLDPLASGVLPLAIGQATKTINFIKKKEKIYSFYIKWGEETETDDKEGKVINLSKVRPKKEDIIKIIKKYFIGRIKQKPPRYSAIKINGRRAYQLARENKNFKIKIKEILIKEFLLIKCHSKNLAEFKIICSSGTYIRALARDLGIKLGTLGHALNIKRTQDNFFKIDNSLELDTILNYNKNSFNKNILPLDFVLKDFIVIEIEKKYLGELQTGKTIFIESFQNKNYGHEQSVLIKHKDRLVSIANLEKGYIIPRRNFNI